MTIARRIAVLVCLIAAPSLALSGCQSAPEQLEKRSADTQSISIDTPGVPGAQCVLTSATVGRLTVNTPAKIEVDRSTEIIVARCTKRCYVESSIMIASEGQRLSSGGVIYSYPAETQVTLAPATSCDETSTKKGRASPL